MHIENTLKAHGHGVKSVIRQQLKHEPNFFLNCPQTATNHQNLHRNENVDNALEFCGNTDRQNKNGASLYSAHTLMQNIEGETWGVCIHHLSIWCVCRSAEHSNIFKADTHPYNEYHALFSTLINNVVWKEYFSFYSFNLPVLCFRIFGCCWVK